jgi:hypothetical protein
VRALDEGFEGAVEEVGGVRVFEAAFAAFCDGGTEGAGYDDLEANLLASSRAGTLG